MPTSHCSVPLAFANSSARMITFGGAICAEPFCVGCRSFRFFGQIARRPLEPMGDHCNCGQLGPFTLPRCAPVPGFVLDVFDRASILLFRYVIVPDSNAQSFDGVVSGNCIHVGKATDSAGAKFRDHTLDASRTGSISFLVISVAGWLNQRQQATCHRVLVEENRVLREHLGSRRLRFT